MTGTQADAAGSTTASGPDSSVDLLEQMFTDQPLPPSRSDRSLAKRITFTLAVLAFAAMAVFSYRLVMSWVPQDYSTTPLDRAEVSFTLSPGAGPEQVARALFDAGIVASPDAFLNEVSRSGGFDLSPGVYTLSTFSSASQALADLRNPDNRQVVRLAVPEGLRAAAIAQRVQDQLGIPSEEFLAAVAAAPTPSWVPPDAGAEGLLFPATYEFLGVETASQVVDTMLDRFLLEVRSLSLQARADAIGVPLYDLVTVASIAQAEVAPADYDRAAAVIYNRLDQKMPLQMDSTVNYALGTSTPDLSAQALATESEYNTYLSPGLPPTPISNPGTQALVAASSPAQGDWLYFVTVNLDTGKTRFTDSYEEFLKFKKQFKKHLASR